MRPGIFGEVKMKKSGSLLLLTIFVLSLCYMSFAQEKALPPAPVPIGEFVQFERIDAFTDGEGAFLRWDMKSETGNVGFLVYRNTNRGPVLVTPGLFQGTKAGPLNITRYGEKYELFDVNGTLNSTYVIVSQAVDGHRVWTQPFDARYTSDFEGDTGHTKAELLARAQNTNDQINISGLNLTKELNSLVYGSRPRPNPLNQHRVATQQGVKIAVKTEGMYRVTRAELQAAGFNVDGDSSTWRLFVQGNEQAIIVGANNQYIEFYGRGMDTAESDTRIYYLIADTVAGKRMVTKFLGSIGGNVVTHNYRAVTERKERRQYNSSIQNGAVENFFGEAVINNPPLTETFDLTSVDPNGLDAYLTIRLQGLLATAHNIRVFINGVDAGIMTGSGMTNFGATFVVPASLLHDGSNTLTLNTTMSSDVCYFDSVKVIYSRKYAASQNKVNFFTPGYRKTDVTGFTSPNVRVFDTTIDGDPQQITDLSIVPDGSTFSVKMPSNRPAVFYAVEDSALLQSPSVTIDNPSTLSDPTNTADVLIISYSAADFMNVANAWAAYRHNRTGGEFNVKVVDVADIFDEFSYGVRSGTAINDFLKYTRTQWSGPKPAYVLLLGDASYDPRNYLGFGNSDLVPTKMVSLIYEETGSDEALADFDHNGVADISVGRIPGRTAASLTAVLNKTMAFETPAMQSLDRGALFAYDMPLGYDFEAMSQVLRNQLPASMPVTYVRRGLPEPNPMHIQDPLAHQNLINAINTGKFIVNYSGHGSAGVWASSSFFQNNDIGALTNANSQSIFLMLTCYNGLFIRPDADSLGEVLLKAQNGGSVATWSSTTETTPDYQLTMGIEFYRLVTLSTIPRMGDLVKNAKTVIAGSDVGYSWVLLGDPMLKVRPQL